MKKRMLITTIVMVLVVAIALTTSSLAWFTLSASVSISEVSFGAVAYQGSQLSVAGLDRLNFGAGASIGTGVTFEPSQGDPTVESFTLGNGSTTQYDKPSFAAGTFHRASSVETTGVGNETKDQKVKLESSDQAVFVGGFNVRNDGNGDATTKISAVLNVGRANLINPNGSSTMDGDEFYLYGTPNSTAAASWVAVEGPAFPINELKEAKGYYTDGTAANYVKSSADNALAGGLRVAVFTRTWVYTLAVEGDPGTPASYANSEEITREGIYSFTKYSVTWGANGWVVNNNAGNNNDLYVETPNGSLTYSMNENLASGGAFVDEGTAGIGTYDVDPQENDNLPTYTKVIKGKNNVAVAAGTLEGIEVVVVVWMDGWDAESVPAAGGGRVSLSYSVTDVVI